MSGPFVRLVKIVCTGCVCLGVMVSTAMAESRTKHGNISIQEWVRRSANTADHILGLAIDKYSRHIRTNGDAELVQAMKDSRVKLREIFQAGRIYWSSEVKPEPRTCAQDDETSLFANQKKNFIHICNSAINDRRMQVVELAQSLIHEAYHLVDETYYQKDELAPECDAATVEIAAMNWSGYGVRFDPGYIEPCGIKTKIMAASQYND